MRSTEAQQFRFLGGHSRSESAWVRSPAAGRRRVRTTPALSSHLRVDPAEDFRPARKADIQVSRGRRWTGGWSAIEPVALRREDFFRYIDTRIRRVESGGSVDSRVVLTGPRRMLKDVLDSLGQASTIYPFIDEDGEGGVFAEWKAGDTRIEISVDADLEAYASVSEAGVTDYYVEFDDSRPLTLEARQHLRHALDRYSGVVRAGNPDWLAIFVG
jgi:hypothetical protein